MTCQPIKGYTMSVCLGIAFIVHLYLLFLSERYFLHTVLPNTDNFPRYI